jgi:hypothetical protein
MGTVHQESGFSFKINTDDHEPMHVHVWHQGNILIVNFQAEIEIRNNYGFNRNEARRAVSIIEERQAFFQDEWRRIHR